MNPTSHPALNLFRALMAVPSPSGYERQIAQIGRSKLDAVGCAQSSYGAGNVNPNTYTIQTLWVLTFVTQCVIIES